MAITTPIRFERALLADGMFCIVAGVAVAARSGWLRSALDLPEEWPIAVAGVVTIAWGVALAVAARYGATRNVVRSVALVNGLTAIGAVMWLALGASSMTGDGVAVVALAATCVAAFAVWQAIMLRPRR